MDEYLAIVIRKPKVDVEQLDQMENNDRMLKELTAPDVVYQPWCIQYPQLESAQTYELKSSLIYLLCKFHGLVGEDPNKHLKDFHVNIIPLGFMPPYIPPANSASQVSTHNAMYPGCIDATSVTVIPATIASQWKTSESPSDSNVPNPVTQAKSLGSKPVGNSTGNEPPIISQGLGPQHLSTNLPSHALNSVGQWQKQPLTLQQQTSSQPILSQQSYQPPGHQQQQQEQEKHSPKNLALQHQPQQQVQHMQPGQSSLLIHAPNSKDGLKSCELFSRETFKILQERKNYVTSTKLIYLRLKAEKGKVNKYLERGSACSKEEPFRKVKSADSIFNFMIPLSLPLFPLSLPQQQLEQQHHPPRSGDNGNSTTTNSLRARPTNT
ncbi:hypothetical protein CR513_29920, partial [Mucuna pruriens]